MVDPVTRIVATFPSSPTKVGTSTSITSEPDNAWVAARQSHITADLLKVKRANERENSGDDAPHGEASGEIAVLDDRDTQEREEDQASENRETKDEPPERPTFSGESEQIGTRNFDDDTPFGTRVAII